MPELPLNQVIKKHAQLDEPVLAQVFPTAGSSVSISATSHRQIAVKEFVKPRADLSSANKTFQSEFDAALAVTGPEPFNRGGTE